MVKHRNPNRPLAVGVAVVLLSRGELTARQIGKALGVNASRVDACLSRHRSDFFTYRRIDGTGRPIWRAVTTLHAIDEHYRRTGSWL